MNRKLKVRVKQWMWFFTLYFSSVVVLGLAAYLLRLVLEEGV